jgi:hypothetical protein
MLFLRTMLGLDALDGQLILDPNLPKEIGHIRLTGTNAFGMRWNVEATPTRADVRLAS